MGRTEKVVATLLRPYLRCVPPPRPELFKSFKLVSAAGASTEKVLRTALAFCPEWNDTAARRALVSQFT